MPKDWGRLRATPDLDRVLESREDRLHDRLRYVFRSESGRLADRTART